jgi:hypothetical protein
VREQRWNKREKVGKPVAYGPHHHDGKGSVVEPLLKSHALVYCDEDIELVSDRFEKGTVLEVSPA